MAFSQINTKAAAITGAVFGFIMWLFVMPFGFSGMGTGYYGMMGYMIGYASYPGLGFLSVIFGVIIGAIGGAIIAVVYNWSLTLK